MADWSKLPYDILHKVATNLKVIEDFLAFSAVCGSWRSVYLAKQWQPGPQVPLLMFSDRENSSFRSFISLYSNKVCNSELPDACGRRCWESSLGWLVTIGIDLKIHLLNPLSRVSIGLPPKSSLEIQFDEYLQWYDIIEKAFVFRKPCASDANEEELVVVIIYGISKQLAFCRPGYSSWKSVKEKSHAGFVYVTCVKDQLFALCDNGSLVVIDIDSEVVIDINACYLPKDIAILLYMGDWEQLSLVESSGDLWMVYRIRACNPRKPIETTGFLIYTFDFNKKQWIRLNNLGNHTIFLGNSCCVSICTPDCLNCKSNSVYFIGTKTEKPWPYRERRVYLGVYSMANERSEPLCFGTDTPKSYSFPLWLTPSLH